MGWKLLGTKTDKKAEGNYEEGKLDGLYIWWYKAGVVSAKGNHENDLRIGTWTFCMSMVRKKN